VWVYCRSKCEFSRYLQVEKTCYSFVHLRFCWKTLWSRVILDKLIDSLLVKKFPPLCGNRRFITVFTRAHHCSLPSDHSSLYPHPTFWRTILILYIILCPIHATCLAHFILIDLITKSIWWWIQIIKILIMQSSLLPRYLFPLRPKCHHPILEHPQPVFLPHCG